MHDEEERGNEKPGTRAKDARKMYFFWEVLACGKKPYRRLET
jgi:hypothetical protein